MGANQLFCVMNYHLGHSRIYNTGQLRRLLGDLGFRVVDQAIARLMNGEYVERNHYWIRKFRTQDLHREEREHVCSLEA